MQASPIMFFSCLNQEPWTINAPYSKTFQKLLMQQSQRIPVQKDMLSPPITYFDARSFEDVALQKKGANFLSSSKMVRRGAPLFPEDAAGLGCAHADLSEAPVWSFYAEWVQCWADPENMAKRWPSSLWFWRFQHPWSFLGARPHVPLSLPLLPPRTLQCQTLKWALAS